MNTQKFTDIELALIEAEAKHCGFPSAEDFLEIEAGQWRLAVLRAKPSAKKWSIQHRRRLRQSNARCRMDFKYSSLKASKMELAYYLFADGSLYLDSNGEDEVWASAEDFAREHLMNADPLHRADRRLLRKLGGIYKARAKAIKREKRCAKWLAILESFLASEDFLQGCVRATRAAYSGDGASVELFRDGKWRVLDNGQIGNGYDSPGIIISLPTFESAAYDTECHEEEENAIREAAECYADD